MKAVQFRVKTWGAWACLYLSQVLQQTKQSTVPWHSSAASITSCPQSVKEILRWWIFFLLPVTHLPTGRWGMLPFGADNLKTHLSPDLKGNRKLHKKALRGRSLSLSLPPGGRHSSCPAHMTQTVWLHMYKTGLTFASHTNWFFLQTTDSSRSCLCQTLCVTHKHAGNIPIWVKHSLSLTRS